MKNNRTLWILAAMWAAMLLFMYSQNKGKTQVIPPLNVLVKQAQDAERSAGNDAGKLKRVVGQYEAIAKIKQYKQSEEAADSLLRVGIIYETKLKNENQAVNTYQRITNAFSPEKSRAGAEAKTRLVTLKAKMDRRHAKDIGYQAIDWLVAVTGRNPKYSYALALLIITIIFKAITTPLSHAQYKSMKEMQRIQPLVKQLQAKYKDNQQELGKKTMDLYKEHGVNPLSGCLPLLVQMPILMLLYYKVILPYGFQFTKGEFLWIGSWLSHKYPAIVAANLSLPDIPLVLIYTVSMIISQKLSMVDPSQAQQQKIMMYAMPILFAWIFRTFPSAFMLYWLFFNVISTAQQYQILKQPTGPDPHLPAAGPTGGAEGGGPSKPPKRSTAVPGSRSRRRRRRFEAVRIPRPAWQPTPSG